MTNILGRTQTWQQRRSTSQHHTSKQSKALGNINIPDQPRVRWPLAGGLGIQPWKKPAILINIILWHRKRHEQFFKFTSLKLHEFCKDKHSRSDSLALSPSSASFFRKLSDLTHLHLITWYKSCRLKFNSSFKVFGLAISVIAVLSKSHLNPFFSP